MKTPLRVLMIEDSEPDKELVLMELRRGGYDPDYECVDTQNSMIKALEERSWDIILSDYAMPHFDGLSALRIVRGKKIDIPFIIISGTIGEDVAVSVMKAGAQDYIMKDNLRRLVPAVEREIKESEIRLQKKTIETKLYLSEENFRNVFQNSTVGISITSLDGQISVNPAFCSILGYNAAELKNIQWQSITHPDDISADHAIIKDLRSGKMKSTRWEKRYIRKDRTIVWVDISTSLQRDVNDIPLYFITSINDITERKQAEIEKNALTQRLQVILSSLQYSVLVVDEHNTVEFINVAFCKQFELDTDTSRWIGSTAEEFLPLIIPAYSDPAAIMARITEIVNKNTLLVNDEVKMRNGETYLVDFIPLIVDGQPRGRMWLHRNITERKKDEQIITVAQEKLKKAQSVARIGYWAWNIKENHLEWSDEMYSIFGIDKNSFTGSLDKVIAESIHPEDRELVQRSNQSVINYGKPVPLEYRVIWPDSTIHTVWAEAGDSSVDTEGNITALSGIAQDITDRKQKDAKILQLSKAIDQASASVVITDENGIIEYVNSAYTRNSGYSLEETVGKRPSILKSGETPPGTYAQLWKTITSGKEWSGELRNKRKDGTLYWESVIIAPVKNETNQIINYIAVKDDITLQKEMQSHMMRTQRMESIGTLAGGIAHDLNNILGPILLSIEILRMKVPDPSLQNLIDTIETSTIRGKNIVAQVLSFARGSSGTPVLIQVGHIVKEIVNVIKETFARDIEIQSHLPKDLWPVTADPTQIHQVLMNLCVNARDAMPHGGRLSINVKNVHVDEKTVVMHPGITSGQYLEIEVRDSGTGIPDDIQQRIFDPFFTTKEIGKGTGLGLSTVFSIVKNHHGFLVLESKVNKGSSFQVYLPVSGGAGREAERTSQKTIAKGENETILVVDDEASIQLVCQETLRFYNYAVVTANNGSDAIAAFVKAGAKINVMIIDMMMPVMDGKTAAAAIRKIDPLVKIIGMSGHATENLEKSDSTIFDHFLHKPFSGTDLMEALQKVLGK